MLFDPPASFAGRPVGVSSRLHPVEGPRTPWLTEDGVRVDLPAVLDLVEIDPASDRPMWWVAATVGLRHANPALIHLVMGADSGFDLVHLQGEFRWHTPVDVITRLVPRIVALGGDPYSCDFPVTGYPEAAQVSKTRGRRLSDEFLEDIVREYLRHGRGYASKMAAAHSVSESTISSWLRKARQRGILTHTHRGVKGGHWVDIADRPKHTS